MCTESEWGVSLRAREGRRLVSLELRVSCLENSEKSSEKVVGGWVDSEGHRGVQKYPGWYVSGIRQVQKWGQDNVSHPALGWAYAPVVCL